MAQLTAAQCAEEQSLGCKLCRAALSELDADDDGGIALAIFTGPFAEERARKYAERLTDGSL